MLESELETGINISLILLLSAMPESELESRINIEAWDRNKITTNTYIGGMSVKAGEILELTKKEPFTCWFKLLNETIAKFTNERIITDDKEAEEV